MALLGSVFPDEIAAADDVVAELDVTREASSPLDESSATAEIIAVDEEADLDANDSAIAQPPPPPPTASPDAQSGSARARPKMSEPFLRGLWSLAHTVCSSRTLGSALTSFSKPFSDCVVAWDLPKDAPRRVALTIDDAPSDPQLMHAMLDVLRAYHVKATIFIVAEFAQLSEARMDTLRRAVREGHELGNHLCLDASPQNLTPHQFEASLMECDRMIASLDETWRAPGRRQWYRPPHGYMVQHMKGTLARHGYVAALADVFPLDTEVREVTWLVGFITKHVKSGSIILLHAPDVRVTAGKSHERQNNVDVLACCLPKLAADGFELTTLSVLAETYEAWTTGSSGEKSPTPTPVPAETAT